MCERELPPKNRRGVPFESLASDAEASRPRKLCEEAPQNAARAPHRSPLASNTLSNARKSKRGAKRCAHRQRKAVASRDAIFQQHQSPMKAAKLITALALLGLHGAAGDDLCAPASTSAARRVYAVARPRRAPRIVFLTLGHRRRHRRHRPRRRRPRRPCRAGGYGVKFNVPSKPGTLQTESKSGAASAAHRLRSGLPVDRTTPRRLAVGPVTRGLPAGCPGAPSNT